MDLKQQEAKQGASALSQVALPARRLCQIGRHLLVEASGASSAPSSVGTSANGEGASSGSLRRLRVEPLTPLLGAEVYGFDFEPLFSGKSEEALQEIDELFRKYKVLMFREAGLNREQHLTMVRKLAAFWGVGEPKTEQQRQSFKDGLHVNSTQPQLKTHPEIWPLDARQTFGWGRVEQGVEEVINDSGDSPKRELPLDVFRGLYTIQSDKSVSRMVGANIGGAANSWHSDNMYLEQPSLATSIRAVRLPPVGGDTLFADMEQAYQDLDEAFKVRLSSMTSVNGWAWGGKGKMFRKEAERTKDWSYFNWLDRTFKETRFPVIRTHPVSGKKCIYVNQSYTQRIEGPGVEEEGGSAKLLKKLSDLALVPEYQCRFKWKDEGDVLLWDNRCLVHYGLADYGGENGGPRWMDHVATLGETPK